MPTRYGRPDAAIRTLPHRQPPVNRSMLRPPPDQAVEKATTGAARQRTRRLLTGVGGVGPKRQPDSVGRLVGAHEPSVGPAERVPVAVDDQRAAAVAHGAD